MKGCYGYTMKNQFQVKVKQNRKKLRNIGYAPSTIHSWEYSISRPNFGTAIKLAQILDMKISDIPYRQVIINQ